MFGVGIATRDYAVGSRCPSVRAHVGALSTQAYSFFTSVCGFDDADKDILPPSRLKSYEESGRNSKIMFKRV